MTPTAARPKRRRATGPGAERRARVRVVVADGHAIDRRALACLLRDQPDFDIVGEAANSAEAI
ncbi:MAG TPA: hypothetical protein VMS88_05065, partial [Terriglobales bacterium]|nr:hypothetical protein [Terriglobales bacterium]